MEQDNRNMNVGKFRQKKVRVMIVTDLAARGIDIPLLDNVINFNIPSKCKTFVHRVGRVARAGKSGCAWNIVEPYEYPYMCDLFRFLNVPLRASVDDDEKYDPLQSYYGSIPRSLLEPNVQHVDKIMNNNFDIKTSWKLASRGQMMYKK